MKFKEFLVECNVCHRVIGTALRTSSDCFAFQNIQESKVGDEEGYRHVVIRHSIESIKRANYFKHHLIL